MGRYVAAAIAARAAGRSPKPPFRYKHEGDLATVGRKAAIVRLDHLTLTGFAGWAFWGLAHVYFLIGLRNRIAVGFSWLWDYVTFTRRARLITNAPGEKTA
jgi:NADH dehydrogenase